MSGPTMLDKLNNRHAEGNYVNYTPDADVEAGEAVLLTGSIGVAENKIEANRIGSLAVNGIFRMPTDGTIVAKTQGAQLGYNFTTQQLVDGPGDGVECYVAYDSEANDPVIACWLNKVG